MANPKIGVLGPIPRDHIVTYKGEVSQKYGCVTHPVIALSRLMASEGTVIPVTHVRKKDEGPIKKMLAVYEGVVLDHITSEHDQGDVISLKFVDQNNRMEKQTAVMDPILPSDVELIIDCDVFVFVPITDFEIALDTLKYIKANSDGLIIFDAHGPTNTMSVLGERHKKFWVDRDQWLPYIDVLKMNLEESRCIWFEKEYQAEELTPLEDHFTGHLRPLAQYCLEQGTKALIVTMDAEGCMIYTLEEGKLVEKFVSSVKVDHVVDTTGCGDSFAGGLAYGLLHDRTNYVRAAQYANALGALRTQGTGFDVFKSLKETEELIAANYS